MKRLLRSVPLAVLLAVSTAASTHAQYTIEQTLSGGYNRMIKGQTFTPSVGIVPNPGAVTTLDLTEIRFTRSMQSWVGPTSEFYLNIYDGDPVNGTGVFVGSSLESINVGGLGDYSPMRWSFAHLTLDYDHEYWALVSSTNTTGGFDVYCGMREGANDPYAGGTCIAGVAGDEGGYHVKPVHDLGFEMSFGDSVPLTADATTLIGPLPGTVTFDFDAGIANAGDLYILACGTLGSAPGTPLPGGAVLPLNYDPVHVNLIASWNNSQVFFGFIGFLDGSGRAAPRLEWPGLLSAVGLEYTFAGCTFGPVDFVTNAWTVTILPEPVPPSKELYVAYKTPTDNFHLGRIDYLTPATVQNLGSMGKRMIRAIEFAGDGTLYAYESPLWNQGRLFRVNPATAGLTPIGPTTTQRVDSMAWNPVDQTMYGVNAESAELVAIDLATGAITLVGTVTDNGPLSWNWMAGLGVDAAGYFYAYNNAGTTSVSEVGIWRSTQPGGLDFAPVYDLTAEFGLYGSGLTTQTPSPLFIDWSAPDGTAYGWLREYDWDTRGWYRYHWNALGLGWTRFSLYPLLNTLFYSWTAPPATSPLF